MSPKSGQKGETMPQKAIFKNREGTQELWDTCGRVLANGLRDQGSILGCHTKDSKSGTWYLLA